MTRLVAATNCSKMHPAETSLYARCTRRLLAPRTTPKLALRTNGTGPKSRAAIEATSNRVKPTPPAGDGVYAQHVGRMSRGTHELTPLSARRSREEPRAARGRRALHQDALEAGCALA